MGIPDVPSNWIIKDQIIHDWISDGPVQLECYEFQITVASFKLKTMDFETQQVDIIHFKGSDCDLVNVSSNNLCHQGSFEALHKCL